MSDGKRRYRPPSSRRACEANGRATLLPFTRTRLDLQAPAHHMTLFEFRIIVSASNPAICTVKMCCWLYWDVGYRQGLVYRQGSHPTSNVVHA